MAGRDPTVRIAREVDLSHPLFIFERADPVTLKLTQSIVGTVVKLAVLPTGGRDDPFDLLGSLLQRLGASNLAPSPPVFAFFAYEAVGHSRPDVRFAPVGDHTPEAVFMIPERYRVIDHEQQTANDVNVRVPEAVLSKEWLTSRSRLAEDGAHSSEFAWDGWNVDATPERYQNGVRTISDGCRAGAFREVILSFCLHKPFSGNDLSLYDKLRSINPSPHMFYVRVPGFTLLGATPLALMRVESGMVHAETDAGTRPIAAGVPETWVPTDKERDEHQGMVDALRDDLSAILVPGSFRAESTFELRRFSHLQHLFASASGRLHDGASAVDAVRACSPHGGVTGFPKSAAMNKIAQLERQGRGPYGGLVGLFSCDGTADTAVVIRSMWLTSGRLYLQVGAGIVAASDPTSEFQECLNKAQAAMLAVRETEAQSA